MSQIDFVTHTHRENKFGRNPAAAATEDIVDQGGTQVFPSAAGAITIVSDSLNDELTGSGAQTIKLWGLDSNNLLAESSAFNMDGITPVATGLSWRFVHRARVITYGATESNEGQISIKHGSDVIASIPIGYGQTQNAAFVVPDDFTSAYLKRWWAYVIRNSTAFGEMALMVQEPGEEGFSVRRTAPVSATAPLVERFDDSEMDEYPAGSYIKINTLFVNSGTPIIGGGFILKFK